jgi:hypothetical protein
MFLFFIYPVFTFLSLEEKTAECGGKQLQEV